MPEHRPLEMSAEDEERWESVSVHWGKGGGSAGSESSPRSAEKRSAAAAAAVAQKRPTGLVQNHRPARSSCSAPVEKALSPVALDDFLVRSQRRCLFVCSLWL